MIITLLFSIIILNKQVNIPERIWASDLLRENISHMPEDLFILTLDLRPSDSSLYRVHLSISKDENIIVEGETNTFQIAHTPYIIRSRDFGDPSSPIYLTTFSTTSTEDSTYKKILSLGVLPSGNYLIRLEFINSEGMIDTVWEYPFQIMPEEGIEIISPGVPYGESPSLASERPVFIWSGSADSFRLTIGMVVYPELSGEEMLDRYPVFEKGGLKTNYLTYSPEFPPLTEGKYVWRITGFISSSSGIEEEKSLIYTFLIENKPLDEIVKILKKRLGEDNPSLKRIYQEGLRPTGNIWLDGKPISPDELKDILENMKIKIVEVRWK